MAAIAAVVGCSDDPGEPRRPPPERDNSGVFPEVWSSNGYDGQAYEFKTNCSSDYATLNECFLWDVTRVIVVDPDGAGFELRKDFNINSFSGEITRRWVLYGPAGEGLPVQGEYRFLYFKDDEVALEQTVRYQPEVVGYPKQVTWTREGDGLHVRETRPRTSSRACGTRCSCFPRTETSSARPSASSLRIKNYVDEDKARQRRVSLMNVTRARR